MAMEKNFDAQSEEARISQKWLESGAFKAGAHKTRDESFTVMIPPPNVTGALHLGHAFNNTLQDILVRWHRMRGFDTLWQPGQDHAGIATQLQVEKKLALEGKKRTDMSRADFLKEVWAWKGEKGGTIIGQLQRLGCSCDWSRNAFTMSGADGAPEGNEGNFHDAVLKVFVDLYSKGLIYRGKRLVNWDPHFETAISDLEVENVEVDGHMWHFKYPLAGGATYTYIEKDEDGNVVLEEERDYISIATTRPETMLGDGAVAVHPDDARYAPIVGKLCEIPVGPKEHRRLIPIITDEYPDPDFGSGAVKITGAHDFNDYQVAKRGGIPMYRLMDTKGHMRAGGEPYARAAERAAAFAKGAAFGEAEIDTINLVPESYRGLDRFEARKRVIADIDAEGNMIKVEDKKIMQPFGDRSKVVIEPMLTDQWFVDAAKLAPKALDVVKSGKIKIIPESGEKTYYHWLENIEPWCISRQLWWGHQIPVWYGPDNYSLDQMKKGVKWPELTKMFCGENFDAVREQAKAYYNVSDVVELWENGKAFWNSDDEYYSRLTSKDFSDEEAGDFIGLWRDPDVLDTWFSSGLWPFGTLGWPEQTEELKRYFPGSVLVTGQDILFFWVARMIMMSLEVMDDIPFHTVYLHGLVRDEKGVKMSKTLGNVIDPLELIDEFGADATRFTMAAMAGIGSTLKLSKDRVTGYRNFGTKLWNAARFAEMNEAFSPVDFDPKSPTARVNKWIIGETAKARVAIDKALSEYRFNDAASALYSHIWHVLCDWYIEFSKPLLSGDDAALQAETRATLGWAIDQAVIMAHPFMPFITEGLWEAMGARSNMLVHQDWPDYGEELVDEDADREMNWVRNVIERIRSTRTELHVPAGGKLVLNQIELGEAQTGYFERNQALIEKLARIAKVEAVSEVPKGAVAIPVEGGLFALPLAGVIDVGDEVSRLTKSMEKLNKELGGLNGRLGNPKFVESAPAEVVEASRARVLEIAEELEKLEAAKSRMEALL